MKRIARLEDEVQLLEILRHEAAKPRHSCKATREKDCPRCVFDVYHKELMAKREKWAKEDEAADRAGFEVWK